ARVEPGAHAGRRERAVEALHDVRIRQAGLDADGGDEALPAQTDREREGFGMPVTQGGELQTAYRKALTTLPLRVVFQARVECSAARRGTFRPQRPELRELALVGGTRPSAIGMCAAPRHHVVRRHPGALQLRAQLVEECTGLLRTGDAAVDVRRDLPEHASESRSVE